jgi:hypothetical protein
VRYLDLNILTVNHLFGSWEVNERPSGTDADTSVFASCRKVTFKESGDILVEGESNETGKWEMFKETEIIYNPQLNFTFKPEEEVLNAIITRYREDEETGNLSLKVTLYFNSGLELVLERKTELPA